MKTGDQVQISREGMWRKGETGDLIVKIEVEMPREEWAMGLAERGGVDTLRGLLPPRREDLTKSEINKEGRDVEEVELEEKREQDEDQSWVSLFFLSFVLTIRVREGLC